MRRRRRKMSSHPGGRRRRRRRILARDERQTGRVACNSLQALRMVALLLLHLFIMPQLVNLTESSMLSRVESDVAVNGTAVSGTASHRGQFDDELASGDTNGRSSWLTAAIQNKTSEDGNSTDDNSTNDNKLHNPQMNRVISMLPLVSKQLESGSETSNNLQLEANHQPDDLMALEDSPAPSSTHTIHQQRHSSEAPYEKGRNLSSSRAELVARLDERPSNKTAQLMSIQAVPSLTPIYLKHLLPATLRTPQLVAFPHPASARGQLDSEGKPVEVGGGDERQQTFALLPSWPNIYITQREQTTATPATGGGGGGGGAPTQMDPKVPMNFPNWSKATRQDDRERLANSQVEYDDHVRTGTSSNSSNGSGIEQENSNGPLNEQQFWTTSDELDDELKRQQYRNRSRQLLADSWSKLLEQAARNNAMESLMLTNRSIVSLLCDRDDMLVKLKFKRPFYGLIETNLDPERRCRLSGNGSQYYELRIDLYACGTRREMSRLFINNLQIQFHQANSSRSQLKLVAQQEADSTLTWAGELDDEPSEFKTLICSYPSQSLRSPTISQTGPLGGVEPAGNMNLNRWRDGSSNHLAGAGVKSSGSDYEQSPEIDRQQAPTKGGRPFERIVDTRERPNEVGRFGSHGPILMAVALILMTLTVFLLCLIMSVYVGRRKRRQEPSLEASGGGQVETKPRRGDKEDSGLGRLYDLAPAQLANRAADQAVRPVAPPLIKLRPSAHRARGSSEGDVRRGGLDGATEPKQQSGSVAANPNQLRSKQKRMMMATWANTTNRSQNLDSGKRNRSHNRARFMSQNHFRRTSDESSDRSLHDRTSSSELSVTTIEIPYVKTGGDQQRGQSSLVAATNQSKQLIRNASSQAPIRPEPQKVDAELQTDSLRPRTPPPVETVHEEVKTTSHERIVERTTSHLVEEQQVGEATGGAMKQADRRDQKVSKPIRRVSPVPFGSFRAKLTSPNEYRRLNNIVKLFEFESGQIEPESIGSNLRNLFDRYRVRILKVMSPSERAELRRLLNEDEPFRSNVVDSIDVETFNRKLRNNRRFPSQTLSRDAWDLFEEILLDGDMSRATTNESDSSVGLTGLRIAPAGGAEQKQVTSTKQITKRTIESEQEFSKLRINSTERKRSPAQPPGRVKPEASKFEGQAERPTASKVVGRPTPARAAAATDEGEAPCDNATTRQIQVSQSNSTHCDGNRTFNFDTVTSISSPTHFSTFTRSSFDLKQVTKFSEDYPFPYMDE